MKMKNGLGVIILMVISFWIIKLVEVHTGANFTYYFGIYPRSLHGIIGILTSAFIHGDWFHLLSNSVPFAVLGGGIIFFYPTIAKRVFLNIYLLTGMSVWLFARSSFHIAASGLVYGFAGFLFFSGLFRRDLRSLVIATAVAFLYGGLVTGLVPVHTGISFESHLFGALAGIICAFAYKHIKEADELAPEQDNFPTPIYEGYQNIEGKNFKYTFKENKE
jgi:membrane associated rhomboid family serine protease